jgi:hypothetical protein
MTRTLLAVAVVVLVGCDKPTKEDCHKALVNMQHLMGTENTTANASIEGEVRRCQGGSTKEAVACAIKATTLDELRHCDFYKVPEGAPVGSGSGSASTGSASTGSAGK